MRNGSKGVFPNKNCMLSVIAGADERRHSEGVVCLLSPKSLATRAITIIMYIPPDWFIAPKQMRMFVATIATELKIKKTMACESETETRETFACSVDPYCLGVCSWTDCPGNAG